MDSLKIQTTVKGYVAWAVQKYMQIENVPLADATARMIDYWVRDNQKLLRKDYKASIDHYASERGPAGSSTEETTKP